MNQSKSRKPTLHRRKFRLLTCLSAMPICFQSRRAGRKFWALKSFISARSPRILPVTRIVVPSFTKRLKKLSKRARSPKRTLKSKRRLFIFQKPKSSGKESSSVRRCSFRGRVIEAKTWRAERAIRALCGCADSNAPASATRLHTKHKPKQKHNLQTFFE